MTYIEELIKTLMGMGPEMFTVVACIATGYGIRLVPLIPNRFIPALCIFIAGPGYYLGLSNVGRVSPDSTAPIVRMVGTGVILGVAAWILHDKAIAKLETKLFGWIEARRGSKRYRKAADGSFEEVTEEPAAEPKKD